MARKAAVLLILALTAGCGYRAGYLTREDIDTIAVPVFSNNTYYRTIEVDLTRAVVDRLEKETPYRLADSSTADAILEGRITSYHTTVLQENARNTPTESEVVVVVEVTLIRAKTGAVIAKRTVREGDSFSTFAGESELGARAILFRRVAQRIVERTLEQDW